MSGRRRGGSRAAGGGEDGCRRRRNWRTLEADLSVGSDGAAGYKPHRSDQMGPDSEPELTESRS